MLGHLKDAFAKPEDILSHARWIVEKLALALQATLMLESAPSETAELFCANRLNENGVNTFGALRGKADFKKIILRAEMKI
mgnify:FL=1